MKRRKRKRARYHPFHPSHSLDRIRTNRPRPCTTMKSSPAGEESPLRKRTSRTATSIQSLENDILCIIFSFLGLFDLVRCSAVNKSWNGIIKRSKLLHAMYMKQQQRRRSDWSEESLNVYLEELAMEHHRLSLTEPSSVVIDQWKGHSVGVDQCRMKMGLVLTGVGDKVMRLWSLERSKCLQEYSVPDKVPLIDFDFDESKVVGLVGPQICIWRRNGQRSIFPSRDGTFTKGSCMRYFDPEAVVGCEDGTARVFDMYSRKCSRIIRMHAEPVTSLSICDDQLIISGSSLGRITISGLLSDQRVATLRRTDCTGIKTLCFNPRSHLVFSGTTAGFTSCWDLRTMRRVWETRVSPNVVYSLQHLHNDRSTLVVGGIDGVLRIMDQNTGVVLSSYVMDQNTSCSSSGNTHVPVARKMGERLPEDANVNGIPKSARPPITCLAVGMKKVVTTHNSKYIRVWRFNSSQ